MVDADVPVSRRVGVPSLLWRPKEAYYGTLQMLVICQWANLNSVARIGKFGGWLHDSKAQRLSEYRSKSVIFSTDSETFPP